MPGQCDQSGFWWKCRRFRGNFKKLKKKYKHKKHIFKPNTQKENPFPLV